MPLLCPSELRDSTEWPDTNTIYDTLIKSLSTEAADRFFVQFSGAWDVISANKKIGNYEITSPEYQLGDYKPYKFALSSNVNNMVKIMVEQLYSGDNNHDEIKNQIYIIIEKYKDASSNKIPKLIILPYNTGKHWVILGIDIENKKVNYFDPMGVDNSVVSNSFKALGFEYKYNNIKVQFDGNNCGFFSAKAALIMAKEALGLPEEKGFENFASLTNKGIELRKWSCDLFKDTISYYSNKNLRSTTTFAGKINRINLNISNLALISATEGEKFTLPDGFYDDYEIGRSLVPDRFIEYNQKAGYLVDDNIDNLSPEVLDNLIFVRAYEVGFEGTIGQKKRYLYDPFAENDVLISYPIIRSKKPLEYPDKISASDFGLESSKIEKNMANKYLYTPTIRYKDIKTILDIINISVEKISKFKVEELPEIIQIPIYNESSNEAMLINYIPKEKSIELFNPCGGGDLPEILNLCNDLKLNYINKIKSFNDKKSSPLSVLKYMLTNEIDVAIDSNDMFDQMTLGYIKQIKLNPYLRKMDSEKISILKIAETCKKSCRDDVLKQNLSSGTLFFDTKTNKIISNQENKSKNENLSSGTLFFDTKTNKIINKQENKSKNENLSGNINSKNKVNNKPNDTINIKTKTKTNTNLKIAFALIMMTIIMTVLYKYHQNKKFSKAIIQEGKGKIGYIISKL